MNTAHEIPPATPRTAPAAWPIVLLLAVWLGGSGYVIGTLLAPVVPGGWASIVVALGLFAVPVTMLLRGFAGLAYPSARTRVWIFRPFWYALFGMPLLAAAIVAGYVAGWIFGGDQTIAAVFATATGGFLTIVALIGYSGSRQLITRSFEVRMARLPPAFAGMRIVQISDLHVGPQTSRRHLERIERAVREARPDLIVITGDQVDDYGPDAEIFGQAFGQVGTQMGVFAIPGNHDIFAGWAEVREGLERHGFRVLVNEAYPLRKDGETLWLVGTGDPAGRGWPFRGGAEAVPDIAKALGDRKTSDATLALAHNPAIWPELAAAGVELTLSGHTHYGQFALPGVGWSLASVFLRHSMGAYREGQSLLYINPGTNYWGLPLRVGTPPEVSVFTLHRCAEDSTPAVTERSVEPIR